MKLRLKFLTAFFKKSKFLRGKLIFSLSLLNSVGGVGSVGAWVSCVVFDKGGVDNVCL